MGHMSAVPEVYEGGGASRSTDPALGSSAGTDVSLREYVELESRWRDRWQEERDRRYTEVAQEREKALAIKEKADERALNLQAETQKYKDEKANELREQIASERGLYLTREEYDRAHVALEEKLDVALKPLTDFMSARQGQADGADRSTRTVVAAIGVVGLIITLVVAVANGIFG